jgi:hypothetical protein
MTSSSLSYFTCKTFKAGGIGDQIYQLQLMYNIGKSFDLTYVHTPPTNRWCKDLDITEFLGLDIGEEKISTFQEYRTVNVDAYAAAEALVTGVPRSQVFPQLGQSNVIYSLVFSEKLFREHPDYIDVPVKWQLNLREKFFLAQKSSNTKNPFSGDLTSIAVHVRRGDCTWLEDSGKYIFPYGNRVTDADPNDVDVIRAVPTDRYIELLNKILDRYGKDQFEIRVYSDGIPDKFWIDQSLVNRLKYWLMTGFLGFIFNRNPQQNRYVKYNFDERIRRRFESLKSEFDAFKKYKNTTVCIGSDPQLTKEVIHAFVSADIVIVARDEAFPEIGLRDPNDGRILLNVRLNQSEKVGLIRNLVAVRNSPIR